MQKIKCKGKTSKGKDCRKYVSVEGETFCPTHGGESKSSVQEKKKSKPTSQQKSSQKHSVMSQRSGKEAKKKCSKICGTTGNQCKLSISRPGERFCPRHGGLTKNGSAMKNPRSPIPWAALHFASLNFVIVEHSLCKCDPRLSPCKSMQIILWIQQLSSLLSKAPSKKVSAYPSAAALRKWIENAPLKKMNLQEMLLQASRILQVANTKWLRDLMNAKGEIEDLEEVDEEKEKDEEEKDVEENEVSESEKNVEKKNDKGKEEIVEQEEIEEIEEMSESDVEMMVNRDELNEKNEDDEDEECLPAQKKKTDAAKKKQKRAKSQEDLDNDSTLKKTHVIQEQMFPTQNSPAI